MNHHMKINDYFPVILDLVRKLWINLRSIYLVENLKQSVNFRLLNFQNEFLFFSFRKVTIYVFDLFKYKNDAFYRSNGILLFFYLVRKTPCTNLKMHLVWLFRYCFTKQIQVFNWEKIAFGTFISQLTIIYFRER